MSAPARRERVARTVALTLLSLAVGRVSFGQAPPPAEPRPAEAWFKLGTTIFTDFTYQAAPRITDSDKALVHKSEFEVRRAYVNLTGGAADLFSFRITPDVAARQSTTVSGTGLPGDLKVGYARAARIIDQLEARGYIGAFDGSSARVVLRRDDGPAPDADEDDE